MVVVVFVFKCIKITGISFFFPQKDIFTISDTVDKDYTVELYEVSGNEELIQLLCKNDLDGVKKWILSFSEELTQSYKNKQFIFLRVYQLWGIY